MKIHKGDLVQVIAGKDKGKQGKVLLAIPSEERVVVEGANKVTRHIPKRGNTPGQRLEIEKPLHVSNVALLDPVEKKPTRVGYKVEGGKKVRVAKLSGKAL